MRPRKVKEAFIKKATLGHLAHLMEYGLGNVISVRSILNRNPG